MAVICIVFKNSEELPAPHHLTVSTGPKNTSEDTNTTYSIENEENFLCPDITFDNIASYQTHPTCHLHRLIVFIFTKDLYCRSLSLNQRLKRQRHKILSLDFPMHDLAFVDLQNHPYDNNLKGL